MGIVIDTGKADNGTPGTRGLRKSLTLAASACMIVIAAASILADGHFAAQADSVDAAISDREEIFFVIDSAHAAFEGFAVEKPWPEISIVSKYHDIMKEQRSIAKAVIYQSGRQVLFVNRDEMRRGDNDLVVGTIWHEAAHFKAWSDHGVKILAHGPQFRSICRSGLHPSHCREARN